MREFLVPARKLVPVLAKSILVSVVSVWVFFSPLKVFCVCVGGLCCFFSPCLCNAACKIRNYFACQKVCTTSLLLASMQGTGGFDLTGGGGGGGGGGNQEGWR